MTRMQVYLKLYIECNDNANSGVCFLHEKMFSIHSCIAKLGKSRLTIF